METSGRRQHKDNNKSNEMLNSGPSSGGFDQFNQVEKMVHNDEA